MDTVSNTGSARKRGAALEKFSAQKKLPLRFLEEKGVSETDDGCLKFDYGNGARARYRKSPESAHPSYWDTDEALPLRAYVDRAITGTTAYLVEGESDALSLWFHGLRGIGIPGAALAKVLRADDIPGVERIFVVREPDTGGGTFVRGVAARLSELGFTGEVLEISMHPHKDVSDSLVAAKFNDAFVAAIEAATTNALPLTLPRSNTTNRDRCLGVVSLDAVTSEKTEWLWRSRIPRGKISMLVGDPSVGKSFASLAIAAAVTRGQRLPDGEPVVAGDVLLWNGEDGVADTIRPRAEAVGANLERIHVITGEIKDGDSRQFSLHSIELLTQHVSAHPGVALVIIDPIAALLAGVDSHKDADVRASLQPLATFAERTGVAVLCIAHLNKKQADAALYRVGGSIGFVGLARSVLLAAVEPDDGRRAIAPLKCNLAAKPKAVEYRIDDEGRFWWGPTSELTAEKLLAPNGNRAGAVAAAEAFLKEVLANGPRPSAEVDVLREEQMLSEASLERAKKKLKVECYRPGGKNSAWMMRLPREDSQPSP